MDQLAIARRAIEDEISALSAEVVRLENVLESLGGTDSIAPYSKYASAPAASVKASPAVAPAVPTAPRRGRPPRSATAAKSAAESKSAGKGDLNGALELIKAAGKKGIKALSLASLIKKSGGDRPSKEELLGTDKVKMSGKGGGTTYTYVG